MDRGYNDYALFHRLHSAGHTFVVRLKDRAHIFPLRRGRAVCEPGVLKDEDVAFGEAAAQKAYGDDLRLVTFHDAVHEVTYRFLTNNVELSAGTIAAVYKARWDVELFFKWLKQHLKLRTFLGTSKNAVLTQIWVAMLYYLLVSWLKFQSRFAGSLLELTRILGEASLHLVSIVDLLRLRPGNVLPALARAAPPQPRLF